MYVNKRVNKRAKKMTTHVFDQKFPSTSNTVCVKQSRGNQLTHDLLVDGDIMTHW